MIRSTHDRRTAGFGAEPPFEPERPRPVVERRGVVAARAHRDQVVLVERRLRGGDPVFGEPAGLVMPDAIGPASPVARDRML